MPETEKEKALIIFKNYFIRFWTNCRFSAIAAGDASATGIQYPKPNAHKKALPTILIRMADHCSACRP